MRSETLISNFLIWVDSFPYFNWEMPVTVLAMPSKIFMRIYVLVNKNLNHWHSLIITCPYKVLKSVRLSGSV